MVVQEFKGRVGGVKFEAVDTTGAGDAFIGGILNILASYPNLYKVQLGKFFCFWVAILCFVFSISLSHKLFGFANSCVFCCYYCCDNENYGTNT